MSEGDPLVFLEGVLRDVARHFGVAADALAIRSLTGGRQNGLLHVSALNGNSAILRFTPDTDARAPSTDVICAYLHSKFQQTIVDPLETEGFLTKSTGGAIPLPIGASVIDYASPTDRGALKWCLIEDLSEGTLWKDDLTDRACRALARSVAALHAIGFDQMRPYLDRPMFSVDTYRWFHATIDGLCSDTLSARVGNRTVERIHAADRYLSGRLVLTHGDLHGGNVILDKTGVAKLIDWDEAMVAHPERDLAHVQYSLKGMSSGSRMADTLYAVFLEDYRRETGEEISAERLALYTILHLLGRINLFSNASPFRTVELVDELQARLSDLGL